MSKVKHDMSKFKFDPEGKLCYSGCGDPIYPPSKVLCRKCQDDIAERLREIMDKLEETNRNLMKPIGELANNE